MIISLYHAPYVQNFRANESKPSFAISLVDETNYIKFEHLLQVFSQFFRIQRLLHFFPCFCFLAHFEDKSLHSIMSSGPSSSEISSGPSSSSSANNMLFLTSAPRWQFPNRSIIIKQFILIPQHRILLRKQLNSDIVEKTAKLGYCQENSQTHPRCKLAECREETAVHPHMSTVKLPPIRTLARSSL